MKNRPEALHKLDSISLKQEAILSLSVLSRILMMVLPVIGLGLLFIYVFFRFSVLGVSFLLANFIGGFIGAGKLVILSGIASGAPIGVWGIAGLTIYSDFATSLFLLANMQYMYRVPWIGDKLAVLRMTGLSFVQANPWIQRAAFFGVAFFVSLPFQGTGSVLGVFIARFLGFTRLLTVLSISFGSTVGCVAIAIIAELGREKLLKLESHPVLGIIVVVVVLLLTYVLGKKFVGQGMNNNI